MPYRAGMDVRATAPRRPRPSWLDPQPDWRVDTAIAVVLALLQVGATTLAGHNQDEYGSLNVLGYLLLAAGPLSLVFRRRYPVPTLVFAFAVTATYWGLDFPRGPVFFALGTALLTCIVIGHRTAAAVALAVGWVVFTWLPYLTGTEPDPPSWIALVGLATWLAALFAVGEIVRVRRERIDEAWRVHEEEARRRASDERLRIARDLHDVVAHHISLMNVQAGVALHLMDEQPEQARTALSAIKQASGEALQELRSVLDILRQGDGADEAPPRTPTPGLGELDTLVERASAAGLDVRAAVEGTRHPLPVSVDTTAYRIVQEALTNVARHAGSAAAATIRVDYGDDDVVVEVEDDGQGAVVNGAARKGGGSGIPNMRERAEALGGQLDAGPRPGGGFRVRAWLPVHERELEREDAP